MPIIFEARYFTHFIEYGQRKYSANAGYAKKSLVIGLLPGQVKDGLFELGYLFAQQLYPFKLQRSIHHYKRMGEPLTEVIIVSLFDLITGAIENAFSE